MKPLSPLHLTLLAVLLAATGGLASVVAVGVGLGPVLITPLLALVYALLAGLLLWAGLAVRRLKAHKRTWMTPILAMRTAIAARACALVGAASVGTLAGIAAVGLTRLQAPAMSSSALGAGVSALAALALTIVAVLVERWCIVDSDDDEATRGRGEGTTAGGTAGTPA